MQWLSTKFKALRAARDRGASAVEYALVLAAIVAIVAVLVFALGGIVQRQFRDACQKVANGTVPSECVAPPATGGG